MCLPALPLAIAGAALVGAGAGAIQGAKNRKQANAAQAANEARARQDAQRAEQQFNRMNQKQPGVAAMFDKNRRAASGGLGSTFLTGTTGVPNMASFLGGAPSVVGA